MSDEVGTHGAGVREPLGGVEMPSNGPAHEEDPGWRPALVGALWNLVYWHRVEADTRRGLGIGALRRLFVAQTVTVGIVLLTLSLWVLPTSTGASSRWPWVVLPMVALVGLSVVVLWRLPVHATSDWEQFARQYRLRAVRRAAVATGVALSGGVVTAILGFGIGTLGIAGISFVMLAAGAPRISDVARHDAMLRAAGSPVGLIEALRTSPITPGGQTGPAPA